MQHTATSHPATRIGTTLDRDMDRDLAALTPTRGGMIPLLLCVWCAQVLNVTPAACLVCMQVSLLRAVRSAWSWLPTKPM